MVFLRILPGSRSFRGPSCAWNNCIIPSKHVKNIKTRLVCGISLFYTSRLQTSTMEQTFLSTSIFPRCIESRCTEKNQARSLMTSTHASVRCSILVFTDIHTSSPGRGHTKKSKLHSYRIRRPNNQNCIGISYSYSLAKESKLYSYSHSFRYLLVLHDCCNGPSSLSDLLLEKLQVQKWHSLETLQAYSLDISSLPRKDSLQDTKKNSLFKNFCLLFRLFFDMKRFCWRR